MEEKPIELTPAQAKAVNAADKSVCVRAGAGTGKTRVLVERYIRLLREGRERRVGVSNIVAITFTEKAAKEMKDRIRKACLDELRKAKDPETRRLWLRHRNDLDHAQISTIHSLCAQIIRESPVEAGVDPRFSVLDEVEADILLRKTAKQTLVDLIEAGDADAVALVAEYDFNRSLELLGYVVDRRDLLEMCLAGWDLADDEGTLRRWKKALAEARAEAARRAIADPDWQEAVATIRETKPRSEADKIASQRAEIMRILSRIEQGLPEAALPLFASLREPCNCVGGKKAYWAEGDLDRIKDAFKSLRAVLDASPVLGLGDIGDDERKALRLTRALVSVSHRLIEAYMLRKRESGFLDFSDLELIARDLLVKNAAAQERYRSRIRYALVDEFQDTNEIQKEIINALSGGEKTDRLFVVGDAKQSIYRFRRAEVSVFIAVDREIKKAEGESVPLDTNFRSLPGLVQFANHFFSKVMPAQPAADYEATYSPLEPKRQARPDHPLVEFMLPERGDNVDASRRREAELIARRIRLMVDGGEPLVHWPDKEASRAVRYGDIAVLFRAMSGIWLYEQAFREYGIPYYVVAGSGFYARQEIKDMLNLVRVLDNRTDDLALAGLLRSPMFAVSDNTLYLLAAERKTPLFERLIAHTSVGEIEPSEREKLAHASKVVQDLLDVRDRISLPELLTRSLEMTRYDAVLLSQFLGRQKALNVYKLVELARKFDRRGIFTLHDFADYVGQFVASDVREGEAPLSEEAGDVVKIMTIHKAKGLEFPVVFVSDISRKEQVSGKAVYLDPAWGLALKIKDEDGGTLKTIPVSVLAEVEKRKEEAESKRILYVAATRAQDYLVLSGWCPAPEASDRDKPGPWFSWLNDIFNLQEAGDEVACEGGRLRITRDVPYTAGTVRGFHKPLAERFAQEISARQPLPARSSADGETLRPRTSPILCSLATKARFTPSEMLEYHWCPRAYYLHRIIGLPPAGAAQRVAPAADELPPAAHAHARLRGRLAHRALEMLTSGREIPLEDILAAVMGEERLADLGAFRHRLELTPILKDVAAMLARFRESTVFQEIRRAKQVHRELPFLAPFNIPGGRDFCLEGKMDLLYQGEEGWEVLDYKTGDAGGLVVEDGELEGATFRIVRPSSKPSADTTGASGYDIQLAAYCLAAEKLLGERPRGVSLYFLESDEGPRRRTPVTLEYITESYNWVAAVVGKIRGGQFDPIEREGCHCDYEWACRKVQDR